MHHAWLGFLPRQTRFALFGLPPAMVPSGKIPDAEVPPEQILSTLRLLTSGGAVRRLPALTCPRRTCGRVDPKLLGQAQLDLMQVAEL